MGKIVSVPLPHDLPENWNDTNFVSPGGVEVGLTEQHGFNYLMKQVNNAQKAASELDAHLSEMSADDLGAVATGHGNFGEVLTTISATTENEFQTSLSTIIAGMQNYTSKRIVATLGFLGDSSEFECIVTRRTASTALVRLYNLQLNNIIAQKIYTPTGWQVVEWVNPPLVSDVEYRTIERISGKAVFKKMSGGVLTYRLYGETAWKPYRETLGAAPSGYYVDTTTVATDSDLELALKTKAYALTAQKSSHFIIEVTTSGLSLPAGTWYVEVIKKSSELSVFTLRSPHEQGMLMAVRHMVSATLRACEWINPPFVPEVEYRTMERVNSKTVFKKNISGVINYRLDGESGYKPYAQLLGGSAGTNVAPASIE